MILLMTKVMNREGPEGEDLEYDTVNDAGMNREGPEGEDLEYDTVNDTGNEQ